MFDSNHIEDTDLMIRSILENGQEEVPARVWDGISEGLDRAARRRRVVLWLGRSAAAVAAAAAVAVGVMLDWHDTDITYPASDSSMIAVIEDHGNETEMLVAEAKEAAAPVPAKAERPAITAQEAIEDASEVAEEAPATKEMPATEGTPTTEEAAVTKAPATEEAVSGWVEDENDIRKDRVHVSLTLSGNTGSNSPQNKRGIGPFRAPGIYKEPTETTIEHANSHDRYGIPLSFGAGVKINFTRRWSLGFGLNYTLLTSRFDGRYTKVNENGTPDPTIPATVHNTQHYLGIPINAYYNIISRDFVNFYAYAGGAVEKCLADKYAVQLSPVVHHSKSTKGVQLSANAGIGVEFLLGRHVGLYIDPSLRYYFSTGQPHSIRTAQPLMLGFEMGLRFNL